MSKTHRLPKPNATFAGCRGYFFLSPKIQRSGKNVKGSGFVVQADAHQHRQYHKQNVYTHHWSGRTIVPAGIKYSLYLSSLSRACGARTYRNNRIPPIKSSQTIPQSGDRLTAKSPRQCLRYKVGWVCRRKWGASHGQPHGQALLVCTESGYNTKASTKYIITKTVCGQKSQGDLVYNRRGPQLTVSEPAKVGNKLN